MTQDKQLSEIDKKLGRICSMLNGPSGLVTQVALHEERLKNIPTAATLKWHAFLGGIVATLFGIIGFSASQIFK